MGARIWTMPRELRGWARPRPLRVAFLIEDGEHSSLALDGVFADCYNRWGGRFSLIAPCIDGQITQSYWPWLEAYDPDIVYSYVPINRADVLAGCGKNDCAKPFCRVVMRNSRSSCREAVTETGFCVDFYGFVVAGQTRAESGRDYATAPTSLLSRTRL